MEKHEHMKTLWSVLSGSCHPATSNVVGPFIEKAASKLVTGIKFYQPYKGKGDDFDNILAKSLDLDLEQTAHLVLVYQQFEYRGTSEQFESLKNNTHERTGLIEELRQFFNSERSYLLHSLECLLCRSLEPNHCHSEVFKGFLEAYDMKDEIKTSLIKQLKLLRDMEPKAPNLRERLVIIQSLFFYSEHKKFSVKDAIEIAGTCGLRVTGDPDCEDLPTTVLHLESVLLVKLLDLGSTERTWAITDIKLVEEQLQRLSSWPEFSPVLLTWMLIHYSTEGSISSRQFGEIAVKQNVLRVVSDIIRSCVFQGNSPLKELVCSSLCNVVSRLVSAFDTEHLGSVADVRAAASALLDGRRVAEDFWVQADHGLHLIWKETLALFPVDLIALVDLAKSAARTGTRNALRVIDELHNVKSYVEPLDNVPESIVKRTGHLLSLQQAHFPYRNVGFKDLVIPRGTTGHLRGKMVHWQVKISFWDVAIGEIQLLCQQAALGLSAVQSVTLIRVERILTLLEVVVGELNDSLPTYGHQLQHLILSLMERSTTPQLLSSCFTCLSALIHASNVAELAARIYNTSVLPCLERPLLAECDPAFLTSVGILPGTVGTALADTERPQGSYPLTAGFLKLMIAFVQAEFCDPNLMVPCSLFILREIVPFHLAWRYTTLEERDSLTDLCLKWFQRTLEPTAHPQCLYLQQLCARTLLECANGEANSLLHIAGYGSRLAEMQLLRQSNWADVNGRGSVILRQIRQSLSILNLMFYWKTKSGLTGSMTPLEQALSAFNVPHFVSVLANYVFCRFDPRVSFLALKVMRSCAAQWKVSLQACLGNEAPVIRNTWLSSLESELEDVSVLEAIVRLLTDAVDKQPGLIHMLVNGEDRCLKAVAQLLSSESAALRFATMQLLHSFWFHRCSPAIDYFKKRPKFWNDLCQPLLLADKSKESRCAALAFHIAAIELYNSAGKLDSDLQLVVNQLVDKHLADWSHLILCSLPSSQSADLSSSRIQVDENGADVKLLLSGWSEFLVMLAYFGPSTAANLRLKIGRDVLSALIDRAGSAGQHPRLLGKLAELNWNLLRGSKGQLLGSEPEWVQGIGQLLAVVAEEGLPSFPLPFQAALLCSAIFSLRLLKNPSPELVEILEQWTRPVTACAQSCLLDTCKRLETSGTEVSAGHRSTSFVSILALSLMRELILLLKNQQGSKWLLTMKENFLVQCLISSIQYCIHLRKEWGMVEMAFTVLQAVAETEAGSSVLTSLALANSLWLPLEAICKVQPTVYRLGVQLCTIILQQQRHFFLEPALTLVGVHQQLMTDALLQLQNPARKEDILMALDVMSLLYQLSKFQQTWRLEHMHYMRGVLQATTAAVYYAIAYLIRPNWLAARTDQQLSSTVQEVAKQRDASATENEVTLSPTVLEMQNQLLEVVCQGLALLNCYSPPLGALLTEDGIDIARWDRHLHPSFGTPSVESFDAPPSLSFGTLNAVASHCLRLLSKSETSALDRGRLTLVLEQSLCLLLSQALLYIRDPRLPPQEKQLLKRELGAELGSFVESFKRQAQRGLRSPAAVGISRQTSTQGIGADHAFLRLVGRIVQRIFQ